MNGITDSRLTLGAALDAAGLRVAYDPARVNPPGTYRGREAPFYSTDLQYRRPSKREKPPYLRGFSRYFGSGPGSQIFQTLRRKLAG